MANDGGVHVDHAFPLLDQLVVESLMIPLDVTFLGVYLHNMADIPLSQRDDLGQTLEFSGANEALRVGIQIWTAPWQP